MSDVVDALEHAFAGLVDAVAGVAPGWLVLGVALHLANQVARGRGWYAVVARRAATETTPRRRDVVAAWVAGAGAGGVVSARGGDAVRVLVLARRMPGTSCALLTGTLVAETAGETALGRRAARARRWRSASGRTLGAVDDRPCSTSLAGVLALDRRSCLLGRRLRARARLPRTREPAASSLRCPQATRARCCPWQVLSRAAAARRARLLPGRVRPARDARRRPARRVRAVQRAARAVLARRRRRRRRDPRRHLRAGHRHRGAGLAGRRVLRRHEHGADRGRHRAGAGDLRERGSGLGEGRAERGRVRSAA